MAFFYVKNGGTATGDGGRYAAQQSGTWASAFSATTEYYNDLEAALETPTTPPSSGDVICLSNLHSYNKGATTYIDSPAADLLIISVDDADIESEKAGAEEVNTSTTYILFDDESSVVIRGVDITGSGGKYFHGANSHMRFYGGTIGSDTNTSQYTLSVLGNGTYLELNDCIFPVGNALSNHGIFQVGASGKLVVNGGSVRDDGGNQPVFIVTPTSGLSPFSGGRSIVEINGTDFTNMASGMEVIDSVSQSYDDGIEITLNNCKMPSSWSIGTVYGPNSLVEINNCDDAASNYISGLATGAGSYLTNTTIYRNGELDGTSLSHAVTTTARVFGGGTHFKYKLASVWADFSTSKDITVDAIHDDQFGSSARSTDAEIWIEVYIPNASDPGRTIYSSRGSNYFSQTTNAAGTSSEWTEAMTTPIAEEYSITVPAGKGEGFAEVYFCIAEPSITVYVDPAAEVA